MAHAERAGHLHGADPMQSAADSTAALGAVWSPAKDAGLDAGLQIRGIVRGHSRKKAIIGIFRRMQERLRHAFSDQELRKRLRQKRQFRRDLLAIIRPEHLRALLADLRRVKADPD